MENFLSHLFTEFDRLEWPYCVLHGYATLPEEAFSDVDLALDPCVWPHLESLLQQVAGRCGWTLIQKLPHERTACYYVLFHPGRDQHEFLALDFCCDYRRNGRVLLSSSQLLAGRRNYRNFYIPAPATEAIYILLKRVLKQGLEERHGQRVKELYEQDSAGLRKFLAAYFGPAEARLIEENLVSENWKGFCEQAEKWRRMLLRRLALRHPFNPCRYWLGEVPRRIQRFLRPTGVLMVLIGPDGAGKSSVAQGLLEAVQGGFRRKVYLHWRPGLLPPLRRFLGRTEAQEEMETGFTQPHGRSPYGLVRSLLHFAYYTADFVLGYFLKVRVLKVRSSLVVMDRYYYDFLFDLRRYRLNLPAWLPGLVMRLIPQPELVVYLYLEPEKLLERKQELPREELAQQVQALQRIAPTLPHNVQVAADRPLVEVVGATMTALTEVLAARCKNRGG